MELIDKSAIKAEIEKLYKEDYKFLPSDIVESVSDFKDDLLMAIDTLEVKEVDLNKEISQFIDANFEKATIGHKLSLRRVAKHFFELGLKAQEENKL